MGSACDVHNVLLDSDKIIQISNFNLVCGVHEVTYEEIDICLCYWKKVTY